MITHPRCLCFVVVALIAHVTLAADTEVLRPGRVGKPTGDDRVAAARNGDTPITADRFGGNAARAERAPDKTPAQMASTSGDKTLESWNDRIAEYFSFGALGYRLLPLALLAKGEQALFRAPNRIELPPILISAQFSGELVERYFQRAIEREDVVDDMILGTKIDGQSHLSGNVRLALAPSDREIRFDLIFTGLCRSKTRGVNDVIVLQNTAETRFEAHKPFVWNSAGLTTAPAVATAETHSTTHQINSTLPGVIGWVATQVAEGRAAETRAQADAISSQHSAARIQRGLDARVGHLFAWATVISRHLPASSFLRRATRIELSSTPDFVRVVVLRRDLPSTAARTKMPSLPDDCDLAIDIHRRVLQRMARDPLALLVGGAVMDQILVAESPGPDETRDATISGAQRPAWQIVRSPDRQWLLVRHARLAPQPEEDRHLDVTPVAASAGAPVAPAVR